ncbi:MAG: hypothetical protein ACJ8C4_19350 [Gemmataceae bacterium]
MELREALAEIADIRLRMAESELFRGYRSLPIAFSGLLACLAAVLQPIWIDGPHTQVTQYCILWMGIATLSVATAGATMMVRDYLGGESQTRGFTWLALSQLAPPLVVGAILTVIIARDLPQAVVILPGLWQMLFACGLFASWRLLPRAAFGVALFYLASGIVSLALARTEWALHQLVMGVPFGIGQFYAAAVMYWNLERRDETTEVE